MDLTSKSVDELRDIARNLGAEVHHRAGKELLMNAITEKLLTPNDRNVEEQAPAKRERVEDAVLTPEQVKEALKPLKDKHQDLEIAFLEDGTWLLRRGKYMESGNMQMPLTVLKRKAEMFCRPRPVQTLGREGSDPTYTGTVLRA